MSTTKYVAIAARCCGWAISCPADMRCLELPRRMAPLGRHTCASSHASSTLVHLSMQPALQLCVPDRNHCILRPRKGV
jgi:hypothetical protein